MRWRVSARNSLIFLTLSVFSVFFSACSSKGTPTPTPTAIPPAPGYAEVLGVFRENHTEIQNQEYVKTTVIGRPFEWDGYLLRIESSMTGTGYRDLVIDMSGKQEYGQTVSLTVPIKVADSLYTNQHLYFSGKVQKLTKEGVFQATGKILTNPKRGTYQPASFKEVKETFLQKQQRPWYDYRDTVIGSTIAWKAYVLNVAANGEVTLSESQDGKTADIILRGLPREKGLALNKGDGLDIDAVVTGVYASRQDWEASKDGIVVKAYLEVPKPATPTPGATPTKKR